MTHRRLAKRSHLLQLTPVRIGHALVEANQFVPLNLVLQCSAAGAQFLGRFSSVRRDSDQRLSD